MGRAEEPASACVEWAQSPGLIRSDGEQIDRLVEMIAPRFYCPAPHDVTPAKFLKGAGAKAEAKRAAKERSKKAKRLKLDPSTPKTTVQLQEAEGAGGSSDEEGEGGAEGAEEGGGAAGASQRKRRRGAHSVEAAAPSVGRQGTGNAGEEAAGAGWASAGVAPGTRAASHEELRERLQKRLQLLRSNRKAETAEKAKEWRAGHKGGAKALGQGPKKSQAQAKGPGQGAGMGAGQGQGQGKGVGKGRKGGEGAVPQEQHSKQPKGQPSGAGPAANGGLGALVAGMQNGHGGKAGQAANGNVDFEFGKVRLGTSASTGPLGPTGGVKKKGIKKETTGSLLKKAMALQQKIQAAEMSKEEGGQAQGATSLKDQHAWSSAASRAAGQKVMDNPKLLRQSLKKQQKQRHKSAQKWDERRKGATLAGKEKQEKRERHIKQRKDKKIATKIARREKKLMRPGFEGRAGATPINKGGAGGAA